jgi:hypothetical protein
MVFSIIIIILLTVIVVLQLIGKNRLNIDPIIGLLERNGAEQREIVTRQIDNGATEQFKRFDLIKDSINSTLQNSRTETNEQLGKFSGQLDTRLSSIQKQTQETLQANREETNKQLCEF